MSSVISFAEESCWDGEKFRSIRRPVVFVVAGHAIKTGVVVRKEFTADFGIFYDVDDEWLIQILSSELPSVDWSWFVYHKKLDHSGIMIYNPDNGKVVGSIYPRGKTKQKLSGDHTGSNIVPIIKGLEYRAKRIKREAERAARRNRPNPPESS